MFATSQAHITKPSLPNHLIKLVTFFFLHLHHFTEDETEEERKLTKVTILIETLFWLYSSQCSVLQLGDKFGCSHSTMLTPFPQN